MNDGSQVFSRHKQVPTISRLSSQASCFPLPTPRTAPAWLFQHVWLSDKPRLAVQFVFELITLGKVQKVQNGLFMLPIRLQRERPGCGMLALVPVRDNVNRGGREGRQTDGGGASSQGGSETVFLSLGGVAAVFHQP